MGAREIPGVVEVRCGRQRELVEVPIEEPRGVFGVILGIAARGQVADDPAPPFAAQPALCPSQTELRLADARRPGHHGERARQESSAQGPVQFFQPKRMASNGHSSLTNIGRGQTPHPGQASRTIPFWFDDSEHDKGSCHDFLTPNEVTSSGMPNYATESARSGDPSGSLPVNADPICREETEVDYVSSCEFAVTKMAGKSGSDG